jgi:hypothetical protein
MGIQDSTAAAFATVEPDPQSRVDKLPQPYRRVEKIVAEIIHSTLVQCVENERLRVELAARVKSTVCTTV